MRFISVIISLALVYAGITKTSSLWQQIMVVVVAMLICLVININEDERKGDDRW